VGVVPRPSHFFYETFLLTIVNISKKPMAEFKVYRYEEQFNNEGPYTCETNRIRDYTVCEALSKSHSNSKHPSIRIDGLDFATDSGDNFRTACCSLRELKKWFWGYNKWLLQSGFVIAEYVVSAKFDGRSNKQCVFHKTAVIERKVIEQKIKFENWQWKEV